MKVLLADSERDLLVCLKKIIEFNGHEVVTAFDGTQIVTQIANHQFDMVVFNYHIPRVKSDDIIKHLNEENVPVIVLEDHKINSKTLLSDILANSYLSFPFLPYELTELISNVAAKAGSKEKIEFADISIDVSDFKMCGKIRLTNEEIDIFKALVGRSEFSAKKAGPYINSLNNKFEKLNKKLHIKYVMNEGYRLVTENEKS